jgi:CheY-like chemotaxis protein
MLDLPVATIRNWEERYAVVQPVRSAGGHRLFSHEQVEQLRYVASQVARGLTPADAHRLLGERQEGDPPPPRDEPSIRARPLVLIAERDAAAADLAGSVLRSEGFAVDVVLAAADAEERWLERRPQLAIVELMISGGVGAELCRRLKALHAGLVLAISALGARDEALDAGADCFLQKPVDPRQLASTVKDLLAAGIA